MSKLKSNIYLKLGTIFLLVMALMIPASMIKGLIKEREHVQSDAFKEVSSKWSRGQTITGPFLSVPYERITTNKNNSYASPVKKKSWAHFMPSELNINGTLTPEKRYRGIYEVVVYESALVISGKFDKLDFEELDIDTSSLLYEKATLNIGINDLKGLEKQVNLNWNNNNVLFNPGVTTTDLVHSGINAPITLSKNADATYSFKVEIDLKGSQHLYFTPLGKTTDVKLTSNWTTPSFTGDFLPDEREISESGFSSHWNILHLNRNFPQSWIGSTYKIKDSTFGTDLLLPVDNYKKTYRVARYAILFLVLTFMTFFFVEVFNKEFIHPIQYLLVGLAITIFYILLTSFSEHFGFNMAYLTSSVLTLFLISFYTGAILKSMKIRALIMGILLTLYIFIFSIIQMEDYALLLGSIGMFMILAVVMFFSRKIDWYSIKLGSNKNKPDDNNIDFTVS